MTTRATTRPTAQRLNLQALVAPLPIAQLPNGTEHQLCYTAAAAEVFKRIRVFIRVATDGGLIDEGAAEEDVDTCLALVLPTATEDDLASFGERTEVKLAAILAAAGRVDEVLTMLAEQEPQGNAAAGKRAPRSPRNTTSAT